MQKNVRIKMTHCLSLENGSYKLFLFYGMVCLVILLQAKTVSATPSDLVGWWRGDGNAQDSAGTNNPSEISSVSYSVGKIDQAFRFDGHTSFIAIPRGQNLTVTNFTIEAWIFPADNKSPRPIVDCGGPRQASCIQLWVNTTGGFSVNPGALHAVIRNELGGPNGGYEVDDPDPVAPMNQWSHVTFTADAVARTLRLYCNGILVATAASPHAFRQDLFSYVDIGYRDAASSELLAGLHFYGALDEIKIYNRVLSDEEIRSEYETSRLNKPDINEKSKTIAAVKQVAPDINSSAVTINPPPTLSISNSGANIFLSWPSWAANYKLQGADTLTPLVVWSNMAVTLETNSDKVIATVPAVKESQFFRLSQP